MQLSVLFSLRLFVSHGFFVSLSCKVYYCIFYCNRRAKSFKLAAFALSVMFQDRKWASVPSGKISLSPNSAVHFSHKVTKETGVAAGTYAMTCKCHCSQVVCNLEPKVFWRLGFQGRRWFRIILTLSFAVCPSLKAGATVRVTGIGLFLGLLRASRLSPPWMYDSRPHTSAASLIFTTTRPHR